MPGIRLFFGNPNSIQTNITLAKVNIRTVYFKRLMVYQDIDSISSCFETSEQVFLALSKDGNNEWK